MNIPFVSILILLAVSLFACQTEPAPQSEPIAPKAIPVVLEKVTASEERIEIPMSGVLAAREEMQLGFKVGGLIQTVLVREGQTVRKGQVLAKLDPLEIDAQVSQANSNLEKIKRDLARVENLYADSVATLEQVQDLTTALEVAEAQYKAAAFNQGQTVLRAPASGQILRRLGEPGEVVGPGTPVVLLSSIGRGQVLRGGLSDVEVVQIQLGDEASISLDAYPGQTFTAKVSEIAAGADPFTGTFEVELALQGPQIPLKNGFFGRASIRPNQSQSMVRIPMTALVEVQGTKARIYVPDSSRTGVRSHEISAYVLKDDYLAVPPSELKGEEWIITEGAAYLKPTSTIQVSDPIAQTE